MCHECWVRLQKIENIRQLFLTRQAEYSRIMNTYRGLENSDKAWELLDKARMEYISLTGHHP